MALLENPLCWEHYMEKFQLLLYLEEQQMEVDIKRYNIPNNERTEATMTRDQFNKKLLVLEVSIGSFTHKIAHWSCAKVMSYYRSCQCFKLPVSSKCRNCYLLWPIGGNVAITKYWKLSVFWPGLLTNMCTMGELEQYLCEDKNLLVQNMLLWQHCWMT